MAANSLPRFFPVARPRRPSRLLAWLGFMRLCSRFNREVARLNRTSPHLVADIGLEPEPIGEPRPDQDAGIWVWGLRPR